jgi:ATP-dependent Lhr-like helicase
MFEVRWRWNVTRSLLVERMTTGKKVPAPLIRMRANDWLVQAFPQAAACPETLPAARSTSRWTIRSCARRSRTA